MAAEITDNFNRSDSSSLGANWDVVRGDGLSIVSNTASSGNVNNANIHKTALSVDDHYVQAVCVQNAGSGTRDAYFYARSAASANRNNSYQQDANFGEGSSVLYRVVSGGFSVVSSFTGKTFTDGETIRMEVETTDASTVQIRMYQDGSLYATTNDTNAARITSGKYAGIDLRQIAADNFEAGTLGAEPPAATFVPRIMFI